MYFPDGTDFEGVGIKPDVEVIVPPVPGSDVVMQTALDVFAKR